MFFCHIFVVFGLSLVVGCTEGDMDVLLARLTGEPSRQGSHGIEWCKAGAHSHSGRDVGSAREVTVRTALRLRNVLAAG